MTILHGIPEKVFVSFCIFVGLNAYKMLLDLGKFKCLLFH